MKKSTDIRRVLITGGAGFVGSSLALRLRNTLPAARVTCMDNLFRRGSELNVERLGLAGVEFIKADVRDVASFDLPRFDLVIDAAAEPSVLAGMNGGDARYVVNTNLVGTLNLLEAARDWSAAFLFLSTSRVYPIDALRSIRLSERASRYEIDAMQEIQGISTRGISEEFPLDGARTLYGATKYACEVMVREYAAQFGLRAIVDRCGVIAGPWQMGRVDQGIVALWVAAHVYGRRLSYIGHRGRQVRDIMHVEDLADLIDKQLQSGMDRWDGQVFSVGGGCDRSVSLLELTEHVRKATGRFMEIDEDPNIRPGDVPLYISDTARVSAAFGWRPLRDVASIVGDTARWVRDHEDMLRPILAP
jgi:CDP-paratose 2-epimerase